MSGKERYYDCGCYSRNGVTKETLCADHERIATLATDDELSQPNQAWLDSQDGD